MEGYTRVRERISEEVINRLRVMVNKTREEMEFEDYIEQRIAKSGDDDFTLREDNLVDEVDRIMQGMMVERKDDAPSAKLETTGRSICASSCIQSTVGEQAQTECGETSCNCEAEEGRGIDNVQDLLA
ncbi:hypothetical protein CYLTODRAFT_79674 [Cylindrobasidium torrendii FP15055 ss-10]|uniref:Uncharacterized protein n=1 Tax=Cylindrobasidium torrendii FP15055 ss-10 TaxID=1314674 RepID=A0A0D7BND8_9AGAR|nr:hypothetical protein CYLTODRAFT_79674 [Cylindrobasidium torrendii FP15055 ss-10]